MHDQTVISPGRQSREFSLPIPGFVKVAPTGGVPGILAQLGVDMPM